MQFLADPWVWLVYIPMLVLVDELAVRKKLHLFYILLSGALFGFILEGLMMGMMREGGGMLAMVMLWHMSFTILLTQCVADLLVGRDNLTLLPSWLTVSLLGMTAVLCGLFLYTSTMAVIIAQPVAVSIAAIICISVASMIYRYIPKQMPAPKPGLCLLLTGTGFVLGCIFINIMDQEVGRSPYTMLDHGLRTGIYLLLFSLIIYVWQRSGRKTV